MYFALYSTDKRILDNEEKLCKNSIYNKWLGITGAKFEGPLTKVG